MKTQTGGSIEIRDLVQSLSDDINRLEFKLVDDNLVDCSFKTSPHTESKSKPKFHLLHMKLAVFDGDPLQWVSFWEPF